MAQGRDRQLRIELNDRLVTETGIDQIESMKSIPDEGHIGLQNHGQVVEFRKLYIHPVS